MKNLLFIPAYRCDKQIVRVLEKLIPYADNFEEIIVIDNGSPDRTAEAAAEFANGKTQLAHLKVVRNPENVNLGGSHKMAFLYAIENKFDHVVILHGDDQGNIADFKEVLQISRNQRLDSYYFGARFSRGSKLTNYSWIRTLGNQAFNTIASGINLRWIPDLGGSGLNLFPVALIKEQPFLEYANDLTFHVFLLLNALKSKQQIRFIPITWKEEDQISNVRMLRQGMKLIGLLVRGAFTSGSLREKSHSFSYHPRDWKAVTVDFVPISP